MSDGKHLHVPEELHAKLKAHSERRGIPLQDWVAEQLASAIEREERVRRLITLRTSTLMPTAWSTSPFWAEGGRA